MRKITAQRDFEKSHKEVGVEKSVRCAILKKVTKRLMCEKSRRCAFSRKSHKEVRCGKVTTLRVFEKKSQRGEVWKSHGAARFREKVTKR